MNAIVAVDNGWGIGFRGKLLFSIPEDRRHVRALTTGKTLVMGRKTFLSLPGGKPLPDRAHIILTRDRAFRADDVTICHDLDGLRTALRGTSPGNVMNFGGAEIYRLLLPYCETVYVTKFGTAREADCHFPNLDQAPGWTLTNETPPAQSGDVSYQFCEYRQARVMEL